jgi:hypothetical protein
VSLATEHRDLANIARMYRLSLNARALEHDIKRQHEMAEFLVAGADAAGDLATQHAEIAMWLFATGDVR